jgi:hypothetical protein
LELAHRGWSPTLALRLLPFVYQMADELQWDVMMLRYGFGLLIGQPRLHLPTTPVPTLLVSRRWFFWGIRMGFPSLTLIGLAMDARFSALVVMVLADFGIQKQ